MDIDEVTLAWLAGLLEGEGSFVMPPPSSPNAPRIVISMVDEDIIQRVADIFGVKYMLVKRDALRNPKWKPAYQVHLKGARAVELMRLLRPHMGIRRGAKIDAILAEYGHLQKRRLLTEAEAKAILSQKGKARARDIAAEHDLHIKTVEEIWRGKRWGQLQQLNRITS